VGSFVGAVLGEEVGDTVGEAVGDTVGESVTSLVGEALWVLLGDSVGTSVGAAVRGGVGSRVSGSAGAAVGESVNAVKGRPSQLSHVSGQFVLKTGLPQSLVYLSARNGQLIVPNGVKNVSDAGGSVQHTPQTAGHPALTAGLEHNWENFSKSVV